MESSVVLPEPFGATRATRCPSEMPKEIVKEHTVAEAFGEMFYLEITDHTFFSERTEGPAVYEANRAHTNVRRTTNYVMAVTLHLRSYGVPCP